MRADPVAAGAGLSTEDLRAAVRAVLREVLPVGAAASSGTTSAAAATTDGEVSLRTDADLDAFVRRVAVICEDAAQRAELQAGRRRFRLVPAESRDGRDGRDHRLDHLLNHRGSGTRLSPPQSRPVLRVERGAVTERDVKRAAADGARVVIGRRAVLTPLARDKARSLGVAIEKEI